jgi:hypothetical protein
MSLPELEFQISESIQDRSELGLMAANGAHCIAWSTYYCENWATTYETWYKDSATQLLKDRNDTMDVSSTSILFQPFTVNIHYPKTNKWSQDVITDLKSYSASEYKQGSLAVTIRRKDSVMNAIHILTGNNDLGKWNWEYNQYLGQNKLYPYCWGKKVRQVYSALAGGQPASDYILTAL